MADYIDNDTIHHQLQHQDDGSESILVGTIGGGFSINLNDDLDAPLLEEQIGGGTLNITPCLCGQPGFQNVTQLISDTLNSRKAQRKLIMATTLCFVFMIGELIGGYIAGSLAIMTDAAHLLSDCISFIVSLLAIWLSRKPADNRMSFGYKRAEILGAIISILGIWLLTIFLFYLAVNRLIDNDFEIDANTMMIVSGIGILINIIMAYILHGSCDVSSHGHSHAGHGHSHLINSNKQHSHTHNNHNNNVYHQLQENSGTQSADPATFVINNRIERNHSICSYRSPSHSRTNSFSTVLPNSINHNNNINNNNQNNQNRRSSSNSSLIQFKLQETANNRVNNTISNGGGNSSRIISSDNEYQHYRDSSDVDSSIMMITTNNFQHNNIITNNNNNHTHSHNNASCNSHSHNHQINQNTNNNNNNNDSTNINIRAAVIHVLGDFIQSIGVFLAAIIIKFYPSAKIADPICTFFFSILVIFTTFRIMKESISIILDAVPHNIDYGNVINEFGCISGVVSVHHLNIWNLTMDWPILSVHLIIDQFSNADKILHIANNIAKNKFNIKHATIQIEKHIEILDVHHQ